MKTTILKLTDSDRHQISDILLRRANDIASFKSDLNRKVFLPNSQIDEFPGSVEMALSREIARLRKLADKVMPPKLDEGDDS